MRFPRMCAGAGARCRWRSSGRGGSPNDDMTWLDHLIRALGTEFEKFEQLVALKFVELSLKFINSLVV